MNQMGDIVSKVPKVQEEVKKEAPKIFKKDFFNSEGKKSKGIFKKILKKREKDAVKTGKMLSKIKGWILTITVFLLPLWFLPWGVDKIGGAKQLLLMVLVGIGFLIWLYERLVSGNLTYKKSVVNIILFLLFIVLILNVVFSLHSTTSLYASASNFLNLWNIALLLIFYLLVGTSSKKDRKFKLLDVLLASITLVNAYVLLKIFGLNILGGFTKVIGFNPVGTMNSVAILSGLGLIMAVIGLVFSKKEANKSTRPRVAYIVVGILAFLTILFIGFKFAWYGLIIAMALTLFFKIREEKESQVKDFALPLGVLVVSVVFVLINILGPKIGINLKPQFGLRTIPTEVSITTKASFEIVGQTLHQKGAFGQTLLGVGLGNYDKIWLLEKPGDINTTDFWGIRLSQGNSSFSTWLVEVGYLGSILAVGLLITLLLLAFKQLKKKKEASNLTFIVGSKTQKGTNPDFIFFFVGLIYLVFGWFLYPYNLTLYFVIFLIAGLLVSAHKERLISFSKPIQKALILSLTLILIMVGVVFCSYLNFQRYIASEHIDKGIKREYVSVEGLEGIEVIQKAQEEINKRIQYLARGYNGDKSNDLALRSISDYYMNELQLLVQVENVDINTMVQNALISARKAVETDKTEYRNHFNLAEIYEALIPLTKEAYVFALGNYESAQELNPLSPAPKLGIARSKLAEALRLETTDEPTKKEQQDLLLTEAITSIEESLALKINYSPAHQLMAQIYDAQGKIQEAIESTSNLVVINPENAGLWYRLGLLHYKNQDPEKAEAAFSQAVLLSENYSNARYFLGLIYSMDGRTEEALAQFRNIEELNPDNQEVKTIISNLEAGSVVPEGDPPVEEALVPPIKTPQEEL